MVLIPYRFISSTAADETTSPLTTMGIAGGQETVGMAQMHPSACSAGIISCGANTACRMLQRVARLCSSARNPSAVCSGSGIGPDRLSTIPRTAAVRRSKSCGAAGDLGNHVHNATRADE